MKKVSSLATLLVAWLALSAPLVHAEEQACAAMDAQLIYKMMKAQTLGRDAYACVYTHHSSRGKNHEVHANMKVAAKYVREPATYYEQRLAVETSFPEQAGVGYEEIYTAGDDLTRILMPGALRALGPITMYPEDPKADYLNGENGNKGAVWSWFADWDRMKEGGRLEITCADVRGQEVWLLTIHRGINPDPVYHHDTLKLFIDKETYFPLRTESYRPGDPRPVMAYEFVELDLDAKFSADDLEFEGLALGWNVVGVTIPKGPTLATLKQVEPKLAAADFDATAFMTMLDAALAGLADYQTKITVKLRYHRLRQYRTENMKFLAADGAYSSTIAHLESNYVLLNAGEGFRTVHDPGKDNLIHVLPAGVYRVMGEQTFPTNDPRLFSAIGDDLAKLTWPTIRERINAALITAVKTKTAVASIDDLKGPFLQITEPDQGLSKAPTIIRLTLDPKTHRPRLLEYRGYDDRHAFLSARFDDHQVNQAITNDDLWQ